MTKSQIKAELRRSALEDYSPWYECSDEAFEEIWVYQEGGIIYAPTPVIRTFFLLVAEAL